MLTFDEFERQVDAIEEINRKFEAFGITESQIYEDVNMLFENFIYSHFTEAGCDLFFWWKYENVDKIIYKTVSPDMFNKEPRNIETDVSRIEDLWKYMIKHKDVYFK